MAASASRNIQIRPLTNALIPLIGAIVLLVWAVTEGNRGNNRFGLHPKTGEGGVPVMA